MADKLESDPKMVAAILRRVQIFAPVSMFAIASGIIIFWDNDLSHIVAGAIGLVGFVDYFLFGYLARQFEKKADQWPSN